MKDIHIIDKNNRVFSIICDDFDQDNNFFNFYYVTRIWLPMEINQKSTGIEVNKGIITFAINDIKCVVIEDMNR